MQATSPLPPVPDAVADDSGSPRFGTYQGGFDAVDLLALRPPYRPPRPFRALRHKRWLYAFVATREVAGLAAVVDLTYTTSAFVLAVDLGSGAVLADESFVGLPRPLMRVGDRPGPGLETYYRWPGARFEAWRPPGDARYHLEVRLGVPMPLRAPAFRLQAGLLAAGAAPALTVVAPVSGTGGTVNVTQKWAGLATDGALEVQGRRWSLEGGVGGLDYTQGFLARDTSWRWAFLCGHLEDGTPFGVNLVEGFNEARADVNENALWLGNRLLPLGRARFTFRESEPLDRWSVETLDGRAKLHFRPLAAHRELRNLWLVQSRFVQPVGLWDGELQVDGRTVRFRDVPGVAEDQSMRW